MGKKKIAKKTKNKTTTATTKKKSPAKAKKKKPKAAKTYEHKPPRSEAELRESLSEDLQEAWDRLREFTEELGEQEVRTSYSAIMFAGRVCYTFIRPKKSYLEVCIFLPEQMADPLVKRADAVSKEKFAHIVQVTHRDQVEEPLTDWIRRAYETYA